MVRKRLCANNTLAGSLLYSGAEEGIGASTICGYAVIMMPGDKMRVAETVIGDVRYHRVAVPSRQKDLVAVMLPFCNARDP